MLRLPVNTVWMEKALNMKSKAIIFLFLFCFIFSCKNIDQNNFVHVDLSGVINLDAPDVIYSFDDKYPTDISIRDSIAYIVQIKSDYCLMALNLNTRQVIQSFGISGYGPNDVIFPLFISSIDHEEVLTVLHRWKRKKDVYNTSSSTVGYWRSFWGCVIPVKIIAWKKSEFQSVCEIHFKDASV